MPPITELIAQARRDALAPTPAEAEVARVLQICNACRYCEGFCAVFPAMTRRLVFNQSDIHYLANLCHNCGACLHACQYATPHEFAVDVPRAMTAVRIQTYVDHAWPAALGGLYRRNGLTVALALAASLTLFLLLVAGQTPASADRAHGFYDVLSHQALVALFAPVFGFAVLALAIGVTRFWRESGAPMVAAAPLVEATHDALSLRYLDGGGDGCNDADDTPTHWRRRFHHLTFYGFALCFASTCVATLYHYALGWSAPYALTSLPVLLGTAGGVGLLLGPPGLAWLNLRRAARQQGQTAQRAMDLGLIVLLWLVAATGLALLVWRDSAAMPLWLAGHLGVVMALFLTLPYGKLVHGVYRCAALLKWAIEKRQPSRLRLGD